MGGVSLTQRGDFRAHDHLWHSEGREAEARLFGWLSTELPYEPTTLNLQTRVRARPVGLRPSVELEPTDHPLAVEQRSGITSARVHEIASLVAHG